MNEKELSIAVPVNPEQEVLRHFLNIDFKLGLDQDLKTTILDILNFLDGKGEIMTARISTNRW